LHSYARDSGLATADGGDEFSGCHTL
jgi:hypothetical protein